MKSIRNKLILTYLSLAMATVSLAGLLSFALIIRNAEKMEEEYLVTTAQSIVRQIQAGGVSDHSRLQEIVDTAGFFQNVEVEILDEEKRPMINSRPPGRGLFTLYFSFGNIQNPAGTADRMQEMLEESALLKEKLKEKLEAENELDLDDFFIFRKGESVADIELRQPGTSLQLGQPPRFIPPPGDPPLFRKEGEKIVMPFRTGVGTGGFLSVGGGPDLRSQAVANARNALVISSVIAVIISLLFGLFIGNRITNPVISLSRAAGKMASGNLDIQVEVKDKDEIGALGRQFNTMAAKLKSSFATISQERDILKQFMQDASHHLRTPVTALTTFQELMLSPAGEEKEKREEFLNESLQQLDKLKWIINKLLHLSRLDSGVITPEYSEISAAELISNAWKSVYPLAEKKHISLTMGGGMEDILIRCDIQWMETALANLFENGLLHSPEDSLLTVSAEKRGALVSICVKDNGPGISPEDEPNIFDRFYRAKSNKQPGSGLGLAIVKSVADAHRGSVTVNGNPGRGAEFIITIPVSHNQLRERS